jgi:N-acetylglucosamine kinase-like BadF-type ATPase
MKKNDVRSRRLVIGVDIGNTKTRYALADLQGRVLTVFSGPGANYQETGIEVMKQYIRGALNAMFRNSKRNEDELAAIYYGAAGADTPADFKILRRAFAALTPNAPFDFENDGWIALHSGTRGGPGMVVTCGTGNTNFSVNSKGQRMRIGGLEEALGDILGAPAIARYAMTAAMRSEDHRDEPTILSDLLPKAFGVHSNAELINFERSPAFVETVIKNLFAAAQKGDGVCLALCWQLVKEVLTIVRQFHAGLFQKEKRFTLVLEGSFFKQKYQPFMQMLELALHQRYELTVVVPDYDPVVGALFLAYQTCDHSLTDQQAARLIASYKSAEILV